MFATPTFSALREGSFTPRQKCSDLHFWPCCCLACRPLPTLQEDEAGFFSYLAGGTQAQSARSRHLPFWTDDLKKAKKAYNNGNFDRAIKFFRRASEDGNIVADWYLGHIYRKGRGVPRDDATAFSYYSRVAEYL